jgi:hypothetical protein
VALAFALWARHDTIWGLGTARERDALTVEMGEVARRSGNVETELFAASLRWVALVEQGDPGYLDQLHTFVALAERQEVARWRFAAAVDRSIVALMRGEFDAAQAQLKGVGLHADRDDSDVAYMGFHVRWTLSMLRGRWDDVDAQLAGAAVREHPFLELARCLTAVERGDAGPALRHIATPPAYPRYMTPLWLRLLARTAAVTGDAVLADRARTALAPHRGQWLVSLFGCDVSGPVDLWIAVADAATGRWDEAVEGFTAARDGAERMGARPWSLIARAGLADALAGRGDTATAAALRSDVEREAAEIGMPQLASPHRVDLADAAAAKRAEGASGQPDLQDRGRGAEGEVVDDYAVAGQLGEGPRGRSARFDADAVAGDAGGQRDRVRLGLDGRVQRVGQDVRGRLALGGVAQSHVDGARPDRRLQRPGRALGDDPPVVDDRDPAGEPVGLVQVLRGQQDRRAVRDDRPDDVPDLAAAAWVQPGRGLVQEQQLRRVEDARGKVQPPPHAAGVLLHLPVGGFGEAERGEQLGRAVARRRPAVAEQPTEQHQVLHAGQVLVDRRVLPGEADLRAYGVGLADHVVAEHQGVAAVRTQQRGQHPDCRRLAGAVGAEQPVDGARRHLQVDAVGGPDVPEGLDQTGGLDGLPLTHDDPFSGDEGPCGPGAPMTTATRSGATSEGRETAR